MRFFDQAGQAVPRYLGLGTAVTLGLTGAGVIWLTLRARKKPVATRFRSLASALHSAPQVLRPRFKTSSLAAGSPTVIRRPSQSPSEAYGRTATPELAKAAA